MPWLRRGGEDDTAGAVLRVRLLPVRVRALGRALRARARGSDRAVVDRPCWVHYRSSIAALASLLSQFARGYASDLVPTYAELIQRGADDPPNSYRMTGPQRQLAKEISDGMVALAEALNASRASLDAGAPNPLVAARIAPLDTPVRSKAREQKPNRRPAAATPISGQGRAYAVTVAVSLVAQTRKG
jgi:hypothetical protein